MEWQYDPSPELDLSLAERLRNYPREPEMLVYGLRSLAAFLLRCFLKLYHRFSISGRENLPEQGSFILVCNHASHLDALCLLSALPMKKLHRAFPAAAADYFFQSVTRLGLSSILLNAIPFQRKGGAAKSMAVCRGLLGNPGNILILFPEGTRTSTGKMGEFKPGIGLLAAESPWPVIPCYLEGAFKAYPKGAWFPKPFRLRLCIGKACYYANTPCTREGAHQIAQDLQNAVVNLQKETFDAE